MELVLASGNPAKRDELARLLAPLGLRVLSPAEAGGLPDVEEDRPDFAGNARKKAAAAARATGHHALADDSGLEVDALGGAPGVRSARYAGKGADARANNEKLLRELEDVPDERRGARFVCVLAVARPDGETALLVRGEVRGRILRRPRGEGGFGYDPLFALDEDAPGRGRAFAELSPEEKAAVSHRGRAMRALAERLPGLLAEAR